MEYSKVMLIDDNDVDNFINKKIMQQAKFAATLLSFNNPKKALTYLEENAKALDQLPDLIFLDINMPLMNGWEFLNAFEKLPYTVTFHCSVVMLTSSLDPMDYRRSRLFPSVINYLKTPLNHESLKAVISERERQKKFA